MATLELTDPVSAIAIQRPDLLALLDRPGIDYCCQGSDSVATAIAAETDRERRAPALVTEGGARSC